MWSGSFSHQPQSHSGQEQASSVATGAVETGTHVFSDMSQLPDGSSCLWTRPGSSSRVWGRVPRVCRGQGGMSGDVRAAGTGLMCSWSFSSEGSSTSLLWSSVSNHELKSPVLSQPEIFCLKAHWRWPVPALGYPGGFTPAPVPFPSPPQPDSLVSGLQKKKSHIHLSIIIKTVVALRSSVWFRSRPHY